MWSTVFVLALMASADPLRIGIAIGLISRPRPMLNLLIFWLGGMTTGVAAALGLLVLLHDFTEAVTQTVSAAAASSTMRHLQLGAGVLALAAAAVLAARLVTRQRGGVPVRVDATSAARSGLPTGFSLLPARIQDALESRFLWLTYLAGLGSATNPVEFLLALAAILASGAAMGTQLGAAVMFTVVVLAVVEIPLISYLATPARTEAFMLKLHIWVRAHRPRIFAACVAAVGAVLVAAGT